MHQRPAFDFTRGQHFSDFRHSSPGCPLLGALHPRRDSSRSRDRTTAGGSLGRALDVSFGAYAKFKTKVLSPRWHCLNITALPV